MLKTRFFPNLLKKSKCFSTKPQIHKNNNEYNEIAVYPEIVDTSYDARKSRKIQTWHEKIKKLGTIEEKLLELNMPRYYGYSCVMLNDKKMPYNTLPLIQYCTRTHFKENLPSYYEKNSEKANNFLQLVKSDLEDSLNFEYAEYL